MTTNKGEGEPKRGVGQRGPGKGPRKGSAMDLADGSRPRYPIENGRYVSEKRAVVLLKARGKTTRECAEIIGLTERSINHWLADGLADEVRRIQDEGVEDARALLRAQSMNIARQLVKLTRTAGKEHGPRVKACTEALAITGLTRKTVIEHRHADPLEQATDAELEAQVEAELEAERKERERRAGAAPVGRTL